MNKIRSSFNFLLQNGSLLLISLTFSGQVISAQLDELNFEDSAWHSCITATAKQQKWIKTEDFTAIKCHSAKIRLTEHLEHFSHLESLSLYNNELTELDVRQLKQLRSLNVAGNKLEVLHVHGLSNLTTLYGFKNSIKNINLSGLVSLKQLRLMDNKLATIKISSLDSLEECYLFNNQLATLDIKNLQKLKFLDVRQNPMPDQLYDEFDEMEGITISHDGNAEDWK